MNNTTLHLIDTNAPQNKTPVTTFAQLNLGLNTVKLLCQLIRAVQHHRGATMAFLSGAVEFDQQIQKQQRSIDRALLLITELNKSPEPIIPAELLETIDNEWKTIVIGWQQDEVMNNFEFHCHLVDTLNKLLRHNVRERLSPLFDTGQKEAEPLLDLLLVQLPNEIEQLAMLRGLSTNAAIIKACGKDSHSKLSYLIKAITDDNRRITPLIKLLLPELPENKHQKKPLQKFLLTVQMSILDSPEVITDGEALFELSTTIINDHWAVITHGVQTLESMAYTNILENQPDNAPS